MIKQLPGRPAPAGWPFLRQPQKLPPGQENRLIATNVLIVVALGQLARMQKTGVDASFVYNENGLRVQKTVNGVVTDYTLHGKNIVHMTQGSNELHFFYDASNKPAVVVYNGTPYSYVKNLQGDVVSLLDSNGAVVVSYVYDAWGRPLSKTGTLASTLGTVQPFRYRGYVYDEETGLYYLKSRFYTPPLCRFINEDAYLGVLSVTGAHNWYAYCKNSPLTHSDPSGYFHIPASLIIDAAYSLSNVIQAKAENGVNNFGAAQPYAAVDDKDTNCFSYVLGEKGWRTISNPYNMYDVEFLASIFQMELANAGIGIRPIRSHNSWVADNEYRIAFRVSERDFHFMLQHSDGSWSHKPSSLPSRLLDAENPSVAEWHEYSTRGLWIFEHEFIKNRNWYNSQTLYFAVTMQGE